MKAVEWEISSTRMPHVATATQIKMWVREFLYECAHFYEAYLNSGRAFSESLVAPGSMIFLPSVLICS